MTTNAFPAALILIALALSMALFFPRAGDKRRTVMQIFIVGLYRWARFWLCVAEAVDAGYLRFREHRAACEIRPVNEREVKA